MIRIILLLFIFSLDAYSQVCLLKGMQIDHNCKCGSSCDTFFDQEYLQVLRDSKLDSKRLKPILDNQKATAKAYDKLVRNLPLTQAELLHVDKEAGALDKINAASLSRLNMMLVKKGSKKIDLEKATIEFNKRFMLSLGLNLKNQIKKAGQVRKTSTFAESSMDFMDDDSNAEDMAIKAETEPSDILADEGTSSIESEAQDALDKVSSLEFNYNDEVVKDSSANIFQIVSASYQKMYNEHRLNQMHQDTEEETQIKSEIKLDIHDILRKHSEW